MDKTTINSIAKELKAEILKCCPETEKIILFGSYARGNNTLESDMDIMIVIADDKESVRKRRSVISKISSRLSLKYDILLSIMIRDKEYFQKGAEFIPFYKNIVKEGIEWYGRAA